MRVVQSLKTKIVACVICLMIVCFIIFSIVGNQITKKNVSEAMLDKCVAETEQIADQVELLLSIAKTCGESGSEPHGDCICGGDRFYRYCSCPQ